MDQNPPPKLSRKGTWRTYTTAEGLAGLQTEHIAEDAEGYLWIGTWDNGVCRFDGDEFFTFTTRDGLPYNRVKALLLDRQGRLWFGTDGGACWWDGKEFHRFDQGDGVFDKPISFLFEDREGRVWFGGREALGYWEGYFHDLVPEYCRQHGQAPSDLGVECRGIAQDREGHLWFGFNHGNLMRYDGERFYQYGEEHGLVAGSYAVAQGAEGTLWVGTGNTVYRYDGHTFQPAPMEVGAPVRKIQCDREGRTWFCTGGKGIFCYDGAEFHHFTSQDGLANDLVNAVFQDREGQIWFATWGGGLSCYDPHSTQVLDEKDGLPFNTVTTIAADHQGRIWMGFTVEGFLSDTSKVVSCYDGEHLETLGEQEGMDRCRTLYVDSRDHLWCGGLGLRQYEGGRFLKVAMGEGLEKISVRAIAEDREGHLFFGYVKDASTSQVFYESPLQLTRYDGQKFQTLLTREKADIYTYINALVTGRDQGIWFALGSFNSIGPGEGLGRWHETEGVTYYTVEDGLVNNRVTDLLEDQQGHLWITTSGGLSRFDGQHFHNFTIADGLPSNRVQCACQGQQGHLWFGTDNGVVHYDGQTFQTIRSPQITSVNDLLQDRQGRFWFATGNGLVRYIPGRVPPRVRILQVVAGQVYEGVEEVNTFSQQVLFEYKGLSFRTHPKDMLYTCRLQGYEEEWQKPTREMRAFYQDLPVGEYTFEVRAIDQDLNYSAPAQVRLKVVPDLRDQRIDELERRVRERTRELEEQNRQLFIERAVERVRAEAAAMKESRDIGRLMLALYAGWRECGLRFEYGSFNIVDEQAGWLQLYILAPEGFKTQERIFQKHVVEGMHLFRSNQIALSSAHRGFAQPGVEAAFWKAPETYSDDLRLLWGDSQGAERYAERSGITAPLAYGGIAAIAEKGYQFRQEDLEIVKRFAGAVSLGYTRFFDLQAAEERTRQQARELAVEHVRNEALSMRSTDDLLRVVAVMFWELLRTGTQRSSCNIYFIDEETDRVIHYNARLNAKKFGVSWTSTRASDFLEFDEEVEAEIPVRVKFSEWESPFKDYWLSKKSGAFTLNFTREDTNRFFFERLGGSITPAFVEFYGGEHPQFALPFSYGIINLSQQRPIEEEDQELLRQFSDALSLGFRRYLDFQRLEEQNRALEQANRQIQEANQHKSQFLSRMSHDLRTPMNAILGYTRILLRKLHGAIDARQYQNLENIQLSADHLLTLINDILDLSRIEAGRIDLKPERMDLQQLVTSCTASVESLLKPGVALHQQLAEVAPLYTDPDRLRRALMNLLSNAVKFTERGSITVSLKEVGGWVELSVVDTGIGIPAEDLPHIFEEFRQVERRRVKAEGAGLGLEIAKKSVELLGGSISVESQVGKGTRFTLRIREYIGG